MDNLIKITEYTIILTTFYYDFSDLHGILSYASAISSWGDDYSVQIDGKYGQSLVWHYVQIMK